MDIHVKDYFCQSSEDSPLGHFHQVIALHESPDLTWSEASRLMPNMNKGWYELSRLDVKDRIEFVNDFWTSKMPFHPKLSEFLDQFFHSLDDIGIFMTQKVFDSPFEAHLVYSVENDSGFFRGDLGATPSEVEAFQRSFQNYLLPEDYLAFLQIHNGFSKSTDTGVLSINQLSGFYEKFQQMLNDQNSLMTPKGKIVDPKSLIPFYESFGLPCYQCFWGDWYPDQEMGNIYYSGLTHTISDCQNNGLESSPENLAFPTFSDWLMFYLEKVE